ncbi:type III secretion system export apparatus subunit SctR [Ralstonia sp. 22086]|jgi:type III secretion protein R|uniref:Type III secretion system export apparatus subunit SctR n=2 Tax=Ralstonia TaxID=48736 RepID=A0AA41WRP6_9RALS|nr:MULTISPECIES: type III secretion system export apparatus subunit SctR [Ralstonia]KJK04799.1 type III secretion system protein SsaR [Burkholderiaceae bacterium 26]MCP1171049.1 type III secretion system export apparatus subunit SctR [Ralstonia chuxiongensis]MCT7305241.1 type III secretion system export apparatus subunit SctR [Ralstonia wenshanensis]MDY7510351.1 type III secretion system export apparatus subunit SctR [Ralstonia wenshanensis]UGS88982.1 type III secretion system export apparatus
MGNLPNPVAMIAVVAALGIAPFAALMVTSYTKLVVVFGLLRSALGIQQVPPNIVLNGIALILTVFIMAPVGMDMVDNLRGRNFNLSSQMSVDDVIAILDAAQPPVKKFLQTHTLESERNFFVKSATSIWPKERAAGLKNDDLTVLVPSFTLTELIKAFQVGFVLYIIFVVVDLVVANLLLALGMQMIAPTTISVPFKLLLFVMLDGWSVLVHGLVLSYR